MNDVVYVVELQPVTSFNVTRTKNVPVTLQHVQLQVTTCTMTLGKNIDIDILVPDNVH